MIKKNEKKNAWEAVGKDLGFKIGKAATAKNAFTSLQRVRRKKTLNDSKKSGDERRP